MSKIEHSTLSNFKLWLNVSNENSGWQYELSASSQGIYGSSKLHHSSELQSAVFYFDLF